jgi:site-specific DNA recombinase
MPGTDFAARPEPEPIQCLRPRSPTMNANENPATTDPARLVDLYLRLSIAADGADSLERQEDDGRAWAAREGLTVRKVWRDAGRSGYRNVKRAGFDGALAALKGGEVRTLFVWKLDRLSRKGSGHVGTILDDLARTGGRIYFYKDGLDTSNDTSRMAIVLYSEQARTESANTSLRVRDRKARDRERGRYLGGPPPYGYVVDEDRHFRPQEPEFSVMREVVARVLAGDSLLTVCRDFNSRGVPTRRGGQWRVNTLSAGLRSPGLAGLMSQKTRAEDGSWVSKVEAWRDPETGETVSLMADGFDPIASEAEQARLLAVMDGRLRQYGRGSKVVRQPSSLLGGLLFCAGCHQRANTFGNSYRCRKWHANGTDCPAPLNVSVDVIETAVASAWAQKLASLHDDLDSPLLQAVSVRWLAKNDPGPLQEREDLQAAISEADARMARADDDHYVRATLDTDRHARVTAGLRNRLAGLHARLADLPEPVANIGALLDPALSLPALAASTTYDARELLRLAIVRVDVTAAPRRGARFNPAERMRVRWVGEEDALAVGA